jgi:serine racemase
VALEMLEQVAELDAIIVPVSGGGLISGISIAAKALKPSITILGAEPVGETHHLWILRSSKAQPGFKGA